MPPLTGLPAQPPELGELPCLRGDETGWRRLSFHIPVLARRSRTTLTAVPQLAPVHLPADFGQGAILYSALRIPHSAFSPALHRYCLGGTPVLLRHDSLVHRATHCRCRTCEEDANAARRGCRLHQPPRPTWQPTRPVRARPSVFGLRV